MIQRFCKLSKSNSFFLFGPRGTGKTTLVESRFSKNDSVFIDLLDINYFDTPLPAKNLTAGFKQVLKIGSDLAPQILIAPDLEKIIKIGELGHDKMNHFLI